MAPKRHFSMQTPHLTHFSVSMTWASFTLPLMAPVGQLRAQRVQPRHLSGRIWMVKRLLQTPAGQRFSWMWAMYSSRKYFRVESTGLGAVCPRPQRAFSLMW